MEQVVLPVSTSLPRKGRISEAILVITDLVTSMVHLVATHCPETAEGMAQLFIENVVKFTMGPLWDSKITSQFIKTPSTLAYHPDNRP
jgi:hypothetical protein